MTILQELALVVQRYPELRELLELSRQACEFAGNVHSFALARDVYGKTANQLRAILSPPNIAHLRNLPAPIREGNRGPDAGSDSL